MVDVRVVTSLDQLGEHADAWDRLATASADRLPMLSHAWVSSFLEHRTVDGSPWQCFLAYQAPSWSASCHSSARAGGSPPDAGTCRLAHPFRLSAACGPRPRPPPWSPWSTPRPQQAPRLRMRWYRVRETSPVLASLPAVERRQEGAESAQQSGVAGADDRHGPGLRERRCTATSAATSARRRTAWPVSTPSRSSSSAARRRRTPRTWPGSCASRPRAGRARRARPSPVRRTWWPSTRR